MTRQFASRVDTVKLGQQLCEMHQKQLGHASLNTFTDLRVMLVPVVTSYRWRRWQPNSKPERLADVRMLDEHGVLDNSSILESVSQILEDRVAFGTCDDCGDACYFDQLTPVSGRQLCPICKKELDDSATVHSDSSET